jgi:alkylation response protein AidB-like acyl-CoA dehydrogenase
MDFSVPETLQAEIGRFQTLLNEGLKPKFSAWYQEGTLPREFFDEMGRGDWYGFSWEGGRIVKRSSLRSALLIEELAKVSPGVAVAFLAHNDLCVSGLSLFAGEDLMRKYGEAAVRGNVILCLGSTENEAGSDVANISTKAERVEGGWILNGVKAYVTNGSVADLALVTAVTDPQSGKGKRISMFVVDLSSKGVGRTKLKKQVWIPSDLTRIQMKDLFVPDTHLLGERGRGLQQVLTIFTHSRIFISAMTLGTAEGAFDLAVHHARRREIFGQRIADQQYKAFQMADLYAKMEASRLLIHKACWALDRGDAFRLESSVAKYIAVQTAREVTEWAADLFGATSVIYDHPVHKFPMDAWGSSLGEGTQDVQRLVIFREIMKGQGE